MIEWYHEILIRKEKSHFNPSQTKEIAILERWKGLKNGCLTHFTKKAEVFLLTCLLWETEDLPLNELLLKRMTIALSEFISDGTNKLDRSCC